MGPGSAAAPIFKKMALLTPGLWALGVPLCGRVLPSLRDAIGVQQGLQAAFIEISILNQKTKTGRGHNQTYY